VSFVLEIPLNPRGGKENDKGKEKGGQMDSWEVERKRGKVKDY